MTTFQVKMHCDTIFICCVLIEKSHISYFLKTILYDVGKLLAGTEPWESLEDLHSPIRVTSVVSFSCITITK